MTAVAVIGCTGQLGSDLVSGFTAAGWQVVPAGHDAVRVEDRDSVTSFLAAHPVDVVVNTAAFHQVALCEQDPARSWAVNATGARNVAEAAGRIGARTVYISTDYVFDGTLADTHSYPENRPVSPVNIYGATKAAGEIATLATSADNMVVRISSVFGAAGSRGKVFGAAGSSGRGGNFVETIAAKAQSGQALAVVDDIWMSPSYTRDVTAKLLALLQAEAHGTFHASNAGRITWHEFATEICRQLDAEVPITPTTTDAGSTPRRPRNSSLETAKAEAIGAPQRCWREALRDYLRDRGHLR